MADVRWEHKEVNQQGPRRFFTSSQLWKLESQVRSKRKRVPEAFSKESASIGIYLSKHNTSNNLLVDNRTLNTEHVLFMYILD